MTFTISQELLIAAGYTMWSKNQFQKRVRDDSGSTKYFINIEQSAGFHNQMPMFTPSIQFDVWVGDVQESIKITLVQWFNDSGSHSQITISEMEVELDKYWTRLEGLKYT